ncbi:MAG TPA: patatin-like phospholipase family protein [Thermoanaerobaculia bacterium]|jgi:NTE family protein
MPDDGKTTAIVLSGGGAKGAYEIGVMKALFEGASPATRHQPVAAQIYTGTSVGAYNASFLASQGGVPCLAALDRLEAIWRRRIANTPDSCGNGIYRVRGLPFQGLDPSCFERPFNTLLDWASDGLFFANYAAVRSLNLLTSRAPLRARLSETIDVSALFSTRPFESLVASTIDLAAIRASEKQLTIAASNWRSGTLQLFSKEDVAGSLGQQRIEASASIPGLFAPVVIEGVPYVDGGVLLNTPLRPAIRLGAEVLHVIYLDPLVENIPFPQLPNTLDTIYRLYAIGLAANMKNDILTAQEINAALRMVREGVEPEEPNRAFRVAHRIVEREREGRPYRWVEVHRYRPTSDLGGGGGLLDFRQGFIDQLIRLGYQNAVDHDCGAAGCLVLDRPPARHQLWSPEERQTIVMQTPGPRDRAGS